MNRNQQLARILFALAMASLGILAFVYSDLGLAWYSVPKWLPLPAAFTFASGIILLGGGVGLLFNRTARLSACILLPYLLLWLLLRVPAMVTSPLVAVIWENAAEIATLVCGAWVLFARMAEFGEGSAWRFTAGASGHRIARVLFGLALVAFGISHFAYIEHTAGLVPKWIPFHTGLAYLTGVAHLAAGIGVLFSVVPRLAAALEATMLSLFTVLVWIPAIIADPTSMPLWTEIIISLGIIGGAWVVAESIPARGSSNTTTA